MILRKKTVFSSGLSLADLGKWPGGEGGGRGGHDSLGKNDRLWKKSQQGKQKHPPAPAQRPDPPLIIDKIIHSYVSEKRNVTPDNATPTTRHINFNGH